MAGGSVKLNNYVIKEICGCDPITTYNGMIFLSLEELHEWKIINLWRGIDIAVTDEDIRRDKVVLINGVDVMERGWAGHFICADKCNFRRNTLLTFGDKKWVVSTVGAMVVNRKYDSIGLRRWYETMAFWSKKDEYDDADVSKPIDFCSQCGIFGDTWEDVVVQYNKPDLEANKMHNAVVEELIERIKE